MKAFGSHLGIILVLFTAARPEISTLTRSRSDNDLCPPPSRFSIAASRLLVGGSRGARRCGGRSFTASRAAQRTERLFSTHGPGPRWSPSPPWLAATTTKPSSWARASSQSLPPADHLEWLAAWLASSEADLTLRRLRTPRPSAPRSATIARPSTDGPGADSYRPPRDWPVDALEEVAGWYSWCWVLRAANDIHPLLRGWA